MSRTWYLAKGWKDGQPIGDQIFPASSRSEAGRNARDVVRTNHGPQAQITSITDLGLCHTCNGPAEGGDPCRYCRRGR